MRPSVESSCAVSSIGERLLSTRELARFLGISARTIQRYDSVGRIPEPVRFGNSTRWRLSEILNWLDAGCPKRKEA